MNRFLLVLAFSLMLLGIPSAHARNSAASYDNKYWSQQEFVQAYNASTGTIYRDFVVQVATTSVDTSLAPGINPNASLGQYVVSQNGSTTDSVYVFGVADETIPAGQLGRIAIRGAHKVVFNKGDHGETISNGTILSMCKFGNPAFSQNGTNATIIPGGMACVYTTATGTAGGMLGFVLNSTATTDTGDVGQTSNAQSDTTGAEYWTWIDPQILR